MSAKECESFHPQNASISNPSVRGTMTSRILSRRVCLAGLAVSGLVRATPALAGNFCSDAINDPMPPVKSSMPLGDINHRVAWGVAVEAPGLYDSELVEAITSEAPRFLAIGSGLKFGNLHPQSMSFESRDEPGRINATWSECDDIVALASRLGIPVRGDCLAWNDWLPAWLTDIAHDRSAGWENLLRRDFERHFESVFAHFARLERGSGRALLRWCGVVNEPFNPWTVHAGRPAWREGAWLDAFGLESDGLPGYIHQAFALGERFGRSSETALFVNETNCDNDRYGPIVRPAMLRLVDALQRAGRRVDAVGLECHLMPQWMSDPRNPDWRPFQVFLRELAKRGVEIYLTELDVNDCSVRDMAQRDAQVAAYTRSLVSAALEVPAVSMVTNWDLSDKYSWLRDDGTPTAVYPSLGKWANCVVEPACPRPAIYDQSMRPKAARRGLADALSAP